MFKVNWHHFCLDCRFLGSGKCNDKLYDFYLCENKNFVCVYGDNVNEMLTFPVDMKYGFTYEEVRMALGLLDKYRNTSET